MFTAAAPRGLKERKTGTLGVPALHNSSINNSSTEDSNGHLKSQVSIALPGDTAASVSPTAYIIEQLALASADARDLQLFAEWIYFGRARWLAQHKKYLPDPERLDAERYGSPHQRKAVRHG